MHLAGFRGSADTKWRVPVVDVPDNVEIDFGGVRLQALLGVPADAEGLVIFAHGSGSSRSSPRNNRVAAALRDAGLATLLLDLLTADEERDRANVFDVALLASRLSFAADWSVAAPETAHLPVGYFGASTGAAAALVAAAAPRSPVRAIVSRGGRPDLAGAALPRVTAPTQLIVGSLDMRVVELNRMAYDRLTGPKELVIVPGAGHLFEEPGTLAQVQDHATRWFRRYLAGDRPGSPQGSPRVTQEPDMPRFEVLFEDRRAAGRQLAELLRRHRYSDPVVLALPRGGVPVGFEVAEALGAPLDVLIVRKIGAPGHPELGIGAVVDGSEPQIVLNEDVIREVKTVRRLYRAGKAAPAGRDRASPAALCWRSAGHFRRRPHRDRCRRRYRNRRHSPRGAARDRQYQAGAAGAGGAGGARRQPRGIGG